MAKREVTCKLCSMTGLHWRRSAEGKWVLWTADEQMHVHNGSVRSSDKPKDFPRLQTHESSELLKALEDLTKEVQSLSKELKRLKEMRQLKQLELNL